MAASGSAPSPLAERDLEVLRFAAEQRLFQAAHVAVLLGCSTRSATARLRGLVDQGLLGYRKVFHGEPGAYTITRPALALLGSALPPARVELGAYAHDLAVAWVALAASRGAFGEMREVVSERRIRSKDTTLRADPLREPSERLAVRLGGVGAGGRERLHYPDLLMVTPEGRRIAVEVEMTAKGRARRDRILLGYAGDPRIDAVLYLVERPDLARAVEASARAAGIAELVHVQPMRWGGRVPGAAARTPERTGARSGSRTGARPGARGSGAPGRSAAGASRGEAQR